MFGKTRKNAQIYVDGNLKVIFIMLFPFLPGLSDVDKSLTPSPWTKPRTSYHIPGGVLPIMDYTGRLRPKGVPFQTGGTVYIKG